MRRWVLAFLMAVTANWVSLIYAFGPVSWLLTTILLLGEFLYFNLRPIEKSGAPTKRIWYLKSGCELLRLFLITATVTVFVQMVWLWCQISMITPENSLAAGTAVAGAAFGVLWAVLLEAIVFWNGMIRVYLTSVQLGLAPADYPFSCTGISGYSGGGKKMIAEYENADRPAHSKLDAPKSYGLGLAHKHLPEMQKISGLAHTPAFVPVVCDYYSGMQVLVPLDLKLAGTSAEAVAAGIADYYKEGATVSVHALNEPLPENGLYSNALSGSDRMELYMTVNAAGNQMMLVSLFDNLGKGSSGAAIQCMNLMLGMNETEGLE